MKTSLERQLVRCNQLWHKYWMKSSRECRVGVRILHQSHLPFTKHTLSPGSSVAPGGFLAPGLTSNEREPHLEILVTAGDILSLGHFHLLSFLKQKQLLCPSVRESMSIDLNRLLLPKRRKKRKRKKEKERERLVVKGQSKVTR